MKGRNKSQESLWKEDHQVQRSCGRSRLELFKEQQERQWRWRKMDREEEARDDGTAGTEEPGCGGSAGMIRTLDF